MKIAIIVSLLLSGCAIQPRHVTEKSAMKLCGLQVLEPPNDEGVMVVRMTCRAESEIDKSSREEH